MTADSRVSLLLGRVLINSVHVRFAPKATQLLGSSGMSRRARSGHDGQPDLPHLREMMLRSA